ncbi:MAG: copper oxidase [Acidobacteriota bacterium]|nr:copper oxidase [Acidobacteriota bacterium]
MNIEHILRKCRTLLALAAVALFVLAAAGAARAQTANTTLPIEESPTPTPTPTAPSCERTVKADVVALDQVITYNRLGAVNPAGMMYALRRDVTTINATAGLTAGNVQLRPYKRPRPLVLRMNAGDCLQISFQNLLAPNRRHEDQPLTRYASIHAVGLQLVNSITSDGSNVGNVTAPGGLVAPGASAVYTLYAEREGNHLIYSTAATTGGEGDGGQISMGLFGSVNVEPRGSEWYRSQLTEADLVAAQRRNLDGTLMVSKGGQPMLNYDATYPKGTTSGRAAGSPVLKILDSTLNIVHSDLNAIITGPGRANFPAGTYNPIATAGDRPGATSATTVRNRPFREFTVIYHDELKAVQAFPQFDEKKADGITDNPLAHTLHSVRDAFGINYGTGGIGAEIIANRLGLGPMKDCNDCLYEEFFLSAWTVGDPAQLVDRPANTQVDKEGNKIPGATGATKVLFPDDPSNVYHSYLNDPVKMRVVHAGPKEHHIHHLHAHQWLNSPESDNSSYLDSKALGPGYSFTTEITYGGSGNRNKTPGDSIFHCHFYPHFAQGMWAMWRVHDVFEAGTKMDTLTGQPLKDSRKLPDGEIAAGTPIPAVVPVPTLAMAPMPTPTFQGYPFYIPGVAGHRPPHPPLDTVDDGGLPRHIIVGGTVTHHEDHSPNFSFEKARLDFDKHLETAIAHQIPEAGTTDEIAAMNFHAVRSRASFTPEGASAEFRTNGMPAKPGAPYADPCVTDEGLAATTKERTYKGAYVQLDLTLNKAGWHFPQSRIATLWDDVRPTIEGKRAPEPLFFRANSGDCVTYHHTNLVPRVYVQDDFQVRTPTDVMGQHIHLVKFDVMASDGSGNGWNYEDGTFSPEEVVDRIRAIRKQNGCGGLDSGDSRDGTFTCPVARQHPTLGLAGKDEDGNGVDDWLGAQTTVQRWFVDKTLNLNSGDRTLRTVFTHDHFGPSTHQQGGLYAGLVVEPDGSKWRDPETGVVFGGAGVAARADGGPTSWKADIITYNEAYSYREFLLEFSDFQLAYKAGGGLDAKGRPAADPANVINPPAKDEPGLPTLVEKAKVCPGSGFAPPCPEAISAADVGTMSVNYRNEPIPLRLTDAYNQLAKGEEGDLAHVYRSLTTRANPEMNVQPGFYPPLSADIQPGDPFTPLLRAYEDDPVQIRILVGAHEEGHNFGIHGIKWKYEPSEENSGYRNNQMMGISEHYELVVPKLPRKYDGKQADYLYAPGTSVDDQWNGLWGLMRVYAQKKYDLMELPNNLKNNAIGFSNQGDFDGVCPKAAVKRPLNVTAVAAREALPAGSLVYNGREGNGGKLHDPTAIMFFRSEDIDLNGKVKAGVPIEPLVLRASAGECLEVALTNRLPATDYQFDLPGFSTLPMIVEGFNANDVKPSSHVGLHPQNVFFDVTRSNGVNVGLNPVQTAAPGQTVTYQWYAGDVVPDATNRGMYKAIEFGATGLSSADPIKHSNKGAVGALIIEPAWSSWSEDWWSRASATVSNADSTASFREFVMVFQNDLNFRNNSVTGSTFLDDGQAVPNLAGQEDAEDSGHKAVNYRSEPLWKRMGFDPDAPLSGGDPDDKRTPTRDIDFTNSLNNAQVGGDPVTPVFWATAGQQVRMRLVQPGGHARNNVFMLHGHIWEEEPYTGSSTVIGTNARSNWVGSQYGVGPGSHFDFLLKNGAGGKFGITGDYLYRTFTSPQFSGGIWGIFRVCAPGTVCQPPTKTAVNDPLKGGMQ